MQSQMEIVTGTGANFGGRVESISSYTYDANGNMLKKETGGQTDERVVEYVYNALNQLTEAKKDGVKVGSYTYDGTGMRRSKTVNGVQTKFYWDRGNIINEARGGTITADNLFGPDGIISRSEGGQVNYYYKDGHGDVYYSHPWDNYNPYLEGINYDYDAYGNQKISNDNDTNPFRYCGEYFDDETGLIYLRNRYYDPSVGRFINEDTHWNTSNMIYGDKQYQAGEMRVPDITAIMQSSNLYVYGLNSPIMYHDRTGNFAYSWLLPVIYRDYAFSFAEREWNFWMVNAQYSFDGYIYDQESGNASKIKFGSYYSDYNGCGWIAVYNTLLNLGGFSHPANIVHKLEGSQLVHGTFGIDPLSIRDYFRDRGYRAVYCLDNLDSNAQSGNASILWYWHGEGAHYVDLKWDGKHYIAHNVFKGDTTIRSFSTIQEFLETNKYIGMGVIVVNYSQ